MRVWCVANQKGGVGKTSSTVSLGGLLAHHGMRVLLVDLDPHGSLTSYFKHNPDELEHSVYHLFFNQNAQNPEFVRSLLKPTTHKNVQVLPATTSLATLERTVSGQDGMGLVLSKALSTLWDQYDYALLDTAPILGVLMVNALAACERLVIPTQTEHLALKGLERMVRTLTMVMRSQGRELPFTIVPTMFDRRTMASLAALKAMREQYKGSIWSEKIPVDTRLRDASAAGIFPHQMLDNSRAVRMYSQLLRYLVRQEAVAANLVSE